MDRLGYETLLRQAERLQASLTDLQAEIMELEDAIAEDQLRLRLLESEWRVNFLEIRDQYIRVMAANQRKLALLMEQQTESQRQYRRTQEQIGRAHGQAAE